MLALLRAFRAETLKLKRTLAIWMVLIAPTVITVLYMGVALEQYESLSRRAQETSVWVPFLSSISAMWGLLMFPLFITLETALLASIEHNSHQWKQMFALPLPRWSIYLAKLLVTGLLTLLASLVLILSIAAGGQVIRAVHPGIGFEAPVPWWDITRIALQMWLLTWLIVSIHTWISLRWNSFALASAVGIVAAACNLLVVDSERWNKVFPWVYAGHALPNNTEFLPAALIISVCGAILVAAFGCFEISRRDILE